jgi:nucleotide-binding universal stress UspA family protein
LKRASSVTLYAVHSGEDDDTADGELNDLVHFLGRHQIVAEPVVASRGGSSTGRQILDEALARGAGLIVAGGYGHGRIRELVLGGVTRDLINESALCLCLAH